jgi:hypothetical protein
MATLEVEEAGRQGPEEVLEVLPLDSPPFELLPQPRVDLLQTPVERLLVHLPEPGDIDNLEFGPHADEELVLRGERRERLEELRGDPFPVGGPFLPLRLLVRARIVGGFAFETLRAHEPAQAPGGQLGGEVPELQLGRRNSFTPKGLARLVESQPVPHEEPFQPHRQPSQLLRLRRWPPLPPDVVLIVEEQPFDDDREIGPDVAPPLEQAEYGVIVLDELDHHRLLEVLLLLRLEVGPPAAVGDDLLDERQVPEEELLWGKAVGEFGEGGHGCVYGESYPGI